MMFTCMHGTTVLKFSTRTHTFDMRSSNHVLTGWHRAHAVPARNNQAYTLNLPMMLIKFANAYLANNEADAISASDAAISLHPSNMNVTYGMLSPGCEYNPITGKGIQQNNPVLKRLQARCIDLCVSKVHEKYPDADDNYIKARTCSLLVGN